MQGLFSVQNNAWRGDVDRVSGEIITPMEKDAVNNRGDPAVANETAVNLVGVASTASESDLALSDEHRLACDKGEIRNPAPGNRASADLSTFFT